MILGKIKEIRDQSPLFFREHQLLGILASGLTLNIPKKQTTLFKWPLSFYIFTEAAYI